MNVVSEAGKGRLVSSRWKNTACAYSAPETHARGGCVPSLVWFCLQCISEYPDQIQLPFKLIYRPSIHSPKIFRLLDSILHPTAAGPSYQDSKKKQTRNFSKLDPRLWAALVQIFNFIPPELQTYTIPLNDEFLPLLQGVQNTDTFSLMTILELPGCSVLSDDTIVELKFLHGLTAFDASHTHISASGILSLARTLRANGSLETTRKLQGPWAVRILRLKHCEKIGNSVYEVLSKFPLLSVVDLRGTRCRPLSTQTQSPFLPSKNRALFSSDLALALSALQKYWENVKMFSALPDYQFVLRIKTICHETAAAALSEAEKPVQPPSPERVSPSQVDDDFGDIWHCASFGPNLWEYHGDTSGDKGERSEETSGGEGAGEEWRHHIPLEEDSRNLERTDGDDSVFRQGDNSAPANPPTHHRTSNSSSPEARSSKRQRIDRSQASLASHKPGAHDLNLSSSSDDGTDSDVSAHDTSLTPPPLFPVFKMKAHDHRKPYWYDADWERENTYVPLSKAKGKHDSELMLYRPVRPWKWLERELENVLTKEASNKEARANGNVPLVLSVAPINKKGLKARQELHSMAAAALQRRKMDDSWDQPKPHPKSSSRNPFAKKPVVSVTRDELEFVAQPLKPISSLQVPNFSQELLRNTAKEVGAQCSSDKQNISTSQRQERLRPAPITSAPARSLFGHDTERPAPINTPEESRRPRSAPVAEVPLTNSTSKSSSIAKSSSAIRPKTGRKIIDEKRSQLGGFDWTAWASKRR